MTEDIKQVYNGKVAKLVFGEVFPEDDGCYECKATNENGDVKTTCRLRVKGKNLWYRNTNTIASVK